MAYEYEDEVLSELTQVAINERDNGYFKIAREVEEVYRKAKAFDHIKVIYDKNMNEMSVSDAECIEMIGNELERADDER